MAHFNFNVFQDHSVDITQKADGPNLMDFNVCWLGLAKKFQNNLWKKFFNTVFEEACFEIGLLLITLLFLRGKSTLTGSTIEHLIDIY